MGKWEIIVWIGIAVIFNPIFTYLVFVRRAKVNTKGKIILYATTTMILCLWFGISTRYFIFSVVAAAYFAALAIFKNTLLANIRLDRKHKEIIP